jgi:hypothetical protein
MSGVENTRSEMTPGAAEGEKRVVELQAAHRVMVPIPNSGSSPNNRGNLRFASGIGDRKGVLSPNLRHFSK